MFLEEVPQLRGGCLHTHFYPDLCAHLSDSNTYNKADWKPRTKKTRMNFGEPIISHVHSCACLWGLFIFEASPSWPYPQPFQKATLCFASFLLWLAMIFYQFSGHCAMVVKGASGVAGSSHGEPLKRYLSYLTAALQKRESVMQRWLTFARLVIWLMMNVHVSEPERPGCFVCSLFSSVYFLFHQLCVRSRGGAEFYSDGDWEFSHPPVLLMSLFSPYLYMAGVKWNEMKCHLWW